MGPADYAGAVVHPAALHPQFAPSARASGQPQPPCAGLEYGSRSCPCCSRDYVYAALLHRLDELPQHRGLVLHRLIVVKADSPCRMPHLRRPRSRRSLSLRGMPVGVGLAVPYLAVHGRHFRLTDSEFSMGRGLSRLCTPGEWYVASRNPAALFRRAMSPELRDSFAASPRPSAVRFYALSLSLTVSHRTTLSILRLGGQFLDFARAGRRSKARSRDLLNQGPFSVL